ncbi:hypothetical protein D3C71_1484860 [compost metagenome]
MQESLHVAFRHSGLSGGAGQVDQCAQHLGVVFKRPQFTLSHLQSCSRLAGRLHGGQGVQIERFCLLRICGGTASHQVQIGRLGMG